MRLRFFWQAVLQLAGLIYAVIKYNDREIRNIDDYRPEVAYSLPFNGEWYVANGGITKDTSHSWEILPQRFAYDFLIVDQEGKSYAGDRKDLQSYYCYGREILAPADGIVISLKDNFSDCRIMEEGQTDSDTLDIGGNRIIIRHSDSEYSTICHLMPKSITVQVGQKVRRGQVIARCGNSGNTTEPHVHFQIQNTPHFYSSMSVPIFFSEIEKEVFAEYHRVDTRPLPGQEERREGCIHRGLLVRNSSHP